MDSAPCPQPPGEPTSPPPAPAGEAGSNTGSRSESSTLGRQLGGDLRCVVCGYNLRGLSIRGVCPECGTTVQAAIRAVVDPNARELQPIAHPRLAAAAVVAWMLGALLAALMCWLTHLLDLLSVAGMRTSPPSMLRVLVSLPLAVSAIGAISLVRPHARIPRWQSVCAAVAVLLYVPLGWLLDLHSVRHVQRIGGTVLTNWRPTWPLTMEVVWSCVLVAAILVLLRPNARLMVARCVLLRTGRVDRQTMWAMAFSALVIAIGQVIGQVSIGAAGLGGTVGVTFGTILMVIGGGLLTIGLFGSVFDALRIARAIVRPTRSFKQVVREGVTAPSPSRSIRVDDQSRGSRG